MSKPSQKTTSSKNPRDHARNIKGSLDELIGHLREDIGKFQEQKAQALFETAAEVLTGLRTAFDHYEQKAEPAMIEGTPADQSKLQRSPKQENL